MYGVNRVTLIGNLGKDPESRPLPSGSMVTNFTMATNRRWKDQAGTQQTETEWHHVVAFGRTAEVARDYLKKGEPVFLEGRMRTRDWEDKEGKKHYKTEVVVDNLQLLSSSGRGHNDSSAPSRASREESGVSARPSAAAPASPTSAPAQRTSRQRPTGNEDIPF